MATLKFRTNVKCQGCKMAIATLLDEEPTIIKWKVDIYDPDRILTVVCDPPDPARIIDLLHRAGYQAEPIETK